MHKQVIVVFLLGLTASIYGLDLSHATKTETSEVDPRIFNFINDFYAQVIYPPLNHVVTNLALLGAQVLAGVSQTGLPAPGGRTIQLTEAELRGFWSGLWNDAIKPPIENALTGLSLMTAQVLAGVGLNGVNLSIGKRDLTVEDARIIDALTQALNSVYTQVIQKPLENALSNGALMLAQVLAGLGTNGVDLSTLGSLLGKRDLTVEDARIIDALTQALNSVYTQVIQKPLENALSNGALMLAQVLAGLGTNGVDLSTLGSLLGKRDLTQEDARIIDALTQALNSVYTQVIQKPLENALSNGALMLAQVLAGLGTNGVDLSTLGSLLGKRDLTQDARIIDALTQALNSVYTQVIQKPLENALSNGALMLAQVLAGLGTNGVDLSTLGSLLGKRDLTQEDARIIDALTQALNNVYTQVIQKPLENALSNGALMLAQVLAGLGTNGVDLSTLGSLLGKRDASLADREAQIRGILDTVTGTVVNGLQAVWNNIFAVPLGNFIQNGALAGAQLLAGLGTNGVNLGKREAEARGPVFDSLLEHASGLYTNQVKPIIENALNAAALHLAGVLANFSQNGIGRR